MIEFEPTDPKALRHMKVMGELTVHRRNMREKRQAKAQRDNAPMREAHAATLRRMQPE